MREETRNLAYYEQRFSLINNIQPNMQFKDDYGTWTVCDVYSEHFVQKEVLIACEGELRRIKTIELLDYEEVL